MSAAKMKYKRLPGGKRGFFGQASLWLGDDHLLAVAGWRFTEDYKRYYYRDIQALVLARTSRWAVTLPWFFVVLTLVIVALVARAGAVAWLPEVCWYLVVAVVLAWLYVALKGSVRCSIQTAVSREELPSLLRLWGAQGAIRILGDRIAQAQGTLVAGWTAHVREAPVSEAASVPVATGRTIATPQHGGVPVAAIALYVSLALGGLLFYPPVARFWFLPILVQAGLAAWTLIRNERSGGPRRTKRLTIAALSFVAVMGAAFYGRIVVEVFRAFASRHAPLEVPLNSVLVGVYTAGCLGLAAAGVFLALHKE